jgi:GNAT superfamily N-acetyltransferase
LTTTDAEAADRILMAAFGTTETRVADILRYLSIQPDGWFLALQGDMPVGAVGAMNYGLFAYIGLMAVHPNAQSRGIGRALMQHVLAWLDDRRVPMALLDATEMGYPLYASLGFVEEDLAYVFQRESDAPRLEFSKGAIPIQVTDIPAVAAFDAPIFGADRSALYTTLLVDLPGRAFLARDGAGEITGYLFAQLGRLGPWVARQPAAAETLLRAALSLTYPAKLSVITPQSNRKALELLTRYGFRFARSCRHMRRGDNRLPGQRDFVYGQTSFAVG